MTEIDPVVVGQRNPACAAVSLTCLFVCVGCYDSHARCGEQREIDLWDGHLSFEGALPQSVAVESEVYEVPGTSPSISDDGRWLVTCTVGDDEGVLIVDVLSHETRSFAMNYLDHCPAISGDGSTLVQLRSGAETAQVWLIDRASLDARLVVEGDVLWAALSDDAEYLAYEGCSLLRPRDAFGQRTGDCGLALHRLHLATGAAEVYPEDNDAGLGQNLALMLSGDGENILYLAGLELAGAGVVRGHLERVGPSGRVALPGFFGRASMSDDARMVVGGRPDGRVWNPAQPDPVLDLAAQLDDRYTEIGGLGIPSIPTGDVALSGDGSMAAFSITSGLAPTREVYRLRLADGRLEQVMAGCDVAVSPIAISDNGGTVAVSVFLCPGDSEPVHRTRVFRLGCS